MFISSITESGVSGALEKTLAFQEARVRMIAENIANAQTPGYRTKQLDVVAFQQSLRAALEETRAAPGRRFEVVSDSEVKADESGFLEVTPTEEPVDQVLFHDGTNVSIEQEMSDLANAGLWSDLTAKLLQTRFEGLRKAIRGQV